MALLTDSLAEGLLALTTYQTTLAEMRRFGHECRQARLRSERYRARGGAEGSDSVCNEASTPSAPAPIDS